MPTRAKMMESVTCLEVRSIAHARTVSLDSNAKVNVECVVCLKTLHNCH